MALLNKLFFPAANTTPQQTGAPTTATASASAAATALALSAASASSAGQVPATPNTDTVGSVAAAAAAVAQSTANSATTRRQQNNNQPVHSNNYLSQFPFDGSQVRVLLYRECDKNGRKVLFDSSALQKVPLKEANGNVLKGDRFTRLSETTLHSRNNRNANGNNSKHQSYKQAHSNANFIEVCEEYGYRHNQPNLGEFTGIGEMVFGALAMSFRGTAFKVHWLQQPSRILCSQVFLAPVNTQNGHSPYSTIYANSLATPRTSISSEQGSIDGLSMSSFSLLGYPVSNNGSRQFSLTPSDRSFVSSPLDVPSDQQSISTSVEGGRADSGPRFSSAYTDSGYDGMSRSQMSSDQWSASYQYSARSSLGSVTSDQMDALHKFSLEHAYYPTSSLQEATSDGCLQRRISRNLRTSFENEHAMHDLIGFISDNCSNVGTNTNGGGSEGGSLGVPNYRRPSYSANESRSNPEIGKRRDTLPNGGSKSLHKRAKLGLAVCITMSESFEEEMELFCSEHIALLESMLSRLRASTERAYINHKDFLQIMFHAWQDTQKWFNDLFTAPRIKCPIWLSITTSGNKYSKSVADKFIKELCWLLSLADTKDTNFFISTMLTAILTHHLGWVATMAAFNSTTSPAESSTAAIEQRAKLLQVSQKHPYNALWAQLGDLYGAIGVPPKLARTVIYGTEKLAVERLLNILTYFIRCGEVRRTAKREDFNKETVNALVLKRKNAILKKTSSGSYQTFSAAQRKILGGNSNVGSSASSGLTRTQTCKQNLNTIMDDRESLAETLGEESPEEELDTTQLLRNLKKNEIPNVLAFRDSRFVQQELRIGNYLMDTGIEKKSLLKNSALFASATSAATPLTSSTILSEKDSRIRLLITTPDNEQMPIEDESSVVGSTSDDGAVEAIEIDHVEDTYPEAGVVETGKRNFFWQIVKGSFSLSGEKLGHAGSSQLDRDCTAAAHLLQRQLELEPVSHISLSDLITQNSMGKSDRMTWGMEPRHDTVSLEEEIHFVASQKLIEREHGLNVNNGVVFMLGENEPLVNIKKSNEDLSTAMDGSKTNSSDLASDAGNAGNAGDIEQPLCALHQRTHGPTLSKRHSGVKFNFEQYPQIATNYMKSKNLLLTNYDLLMDKSAKLEAQESGLTLSQFTGASSTLATSASVSGSSTTGTTAATNCSECIVCNRTWSSYQTPSNATELEFETDEVRASITSTNSHPLQSVSSAASIDTLKSSTVCSEVEKEYGSAVAEQFTTTAAAVEPKQKTYNTNVRKVSSHRGSMSSVAAKCAAVNEAMHLLKLPVPAIRELQQEDEPGGDGMKLRAGFVPSLFLSVNDHYISDMVLQGTCASPEKWQMSLREDLALAARAASLISLPAENVAIVANMEKWDVRLISSQLQHFPYAGEQSTPVGMSQLVSSMLETVHAMNGAGISAYECLAYLESKMQEIYLQSESLAAFLLDTEFCQLSTVTTALNLTENDVPLLLSIASIHTPQIAKKCGISFR